MSILKRIFILLIVLNFSRCKKVIVINVKDSDIKFVVEAIITNEPGVCKVYISKSKQYSENNVFEGQSGGVVKVKDNGVEFNLVERLPGVYETNAINGTPGHRYELSVLLNNKVFTASSTMPFPVHMDTLYISKGPFGQFKFATLSYTDPAGINNAYRFVQYVNGIKEPTIFWRDDEFTDGQFTITQLDASGDTKDDPRNIKTGDEVTVEMLSLDEPVYRFWYTLRSGGGDGSTNTAAPGNPVGNIQGGALGYFSAHTIDRKKVIAP